MASADLEYQNDFDESDEVSEIEATISSGSQPWYEVTIFSLFVFDKKT